MYFLFLGAWLKWSQYLHCLGNGKNYLFWHYSNIYLGFTALISSIVIFSFQFQENICMYCESVAKSTRDLHEYIINNVCLKNIISLNIMIITWTIMVNVRFRSLHYHIIVWSIENHSLNDFKLHVRISLYYWMHKNVVFTSLFYTFIFSSMNSHIK